MSSTSSSTSHRSMMSAVRPTQGGLSDGTMRLKLNSREKKQRIFRVVKSKEKYKRHSNFYGNRMRVSVNDTYISQLLDTYAEKRTYRPAIKMYQKLREKKLVPSVYTYRKFLFTVGYRGRQTEEAERIFNDLLEMDDKTWKTDRFCYNTMMHIYAKNVGGMEGYAKARELFDVMSESENPFFRPNNFSYYYLLKCFSSPSEARRHNDSVDAAEADLNTKTETSGIEEEKIMLDDEGKKAVRKVIADMLNDNVLLVSNRHIKTALEKVDMHHVVEEILADTKKEE